MSSRSSAGALIGRHCTLKLTIKTNVGFWGEGKPEYPEKTSRCRIDKQTNKLIPHMTPDLGIDPGAHWWEASVLTRRHPCTPLINAFSICPKDSIHFRFGKWYIYSTFQLNLSYNTNFKNRRSRKRIFCNEKLIRGRVNETGNDVTFV